MSDVAASTNEVEVASKATTEPVSAEAPKAGTSGSPTKTDTDDVKTALQLVAAGKRNLLVQDYHAAESSLSQACEMFAKHYGETSIECAEPSFLYGKALLELARLEAGVINNGLDGDESEEQNSTEEEGDEDEEGDEAEGEGEAEAEGEADEEPRAKEETESIGSNDAGPSAAKETKDVNAIEAEEEEDPSNLQLAWEMIELAKVIYTKHLETLGADSPNRAQFETKLSDTYETLGEVSIENENYNQAIEDLTTSLKMRQKLLPEDSRLIAETHYQLGVALGFNSQFSDAVNALNDAIGVLQKRIENLKNKTESKDSSKGDDAFYTREKEIAEIESLLPEIREKIQDTKDMEAESLKKLGEQKTVEEGVKATEEEGPLTN